MEIDLFATGVVIPAIPLLMTNFGNRYSSLSALIRRLHQDVLAARRAGDRSSEEIIERNIGEIEHLRRRLQLNRVTQFAIGTAFMFDVVAMCLVIMGMPFAATVWFIVTLILIGASMATYLIEIAISANALNLHLQDLEERH